MGAPRRITPEYIEQAYARRKRENLTKYGAVYKMFMDRGGPFWFGALTGEIMNIDQMYSDIDYLKRCIYLGLEAEGVFLSDDKEYAYEYTRVTHDTSKTGNERFRESIKELKTTPIQDHSKRLFLIASGTAAWVDMDEMKAVYRERDRITKQTGIPHAVDHIIPVAHPKVCGLNVPDNLRVITARENAAKSNKFEID